MSAAWESPSDATLHYQYLQAAVTKWRKANTWADSLPFDKWPQKYKDAAHVAANLMQHVGVTCLL